MADNLQELFARLKAQDPGPQAQSNQTPSLWANPQQQPYQAPSISSPLFSPPIHTPNPTHPSSILSPAPPTSNIGSPAPDQHRTNNLLNLLKFNNQGGQGAAGPMANLQNVGGERSASFNIVSGAQGGPRPLSARDLVASLQRKPSAPGALPSPLAGPGAEKPHAQMSSAGNQQDFLLNLLRKPNAQRPVESIETEDVSTGPAVRERSVDRLAQSFAEAAFSKSVTPASSDPQRESSPVRHFGSVASRETTPFAAPQPTKASMFTYVNPFDQLHSSSPMNRTPNPEAQAEPRKIEILKHERDVSSGQHGDSAGPATKSRKLERPSVTPPPAPQTEPKSQSVAEALEGVGETVDKQVEQALADAETKSKPVKSAVGNGTADDTNKIKKEAADDGVDSSWESAEDSANDKKEASKVKVYNFPMKPFFTISIKGTETAVPIRQDNFMVIAQLKKEFDQMDRSLATASQTHIVYAQIATKKENSGFRIIRQDTGDHKQVFRSSGERISNVQVCSPGHDMESVLGTGVNGSVFWTSLSKTRPDLFLEDDLEAQGFIMPAVATSDESTSNSPVKTRAKCSTRHPEFFAISRSKMIHVIAPDTVKDKAYTHPNTRKVDSAAFLAEHGLRINTGKAGKDFTFSEDDSVIVSLDKNGVVKFWDVRELTTRASDRLEGAHEPVELTEPIWSLTAAASGSGKPSVSSIMLLDKERPHTKGVALRYMLVGYKQNHILQLWDLGLGQAVQELRLPHDNDGDGICSIAYHPKTGVAVIGHPTRNSIYFIHLSAPKYNIPSMDQARYVNSLARQDPSLPKPESTAIMSGLREFSLNKVGQLRSLEMLRTPVDNASDKGTEDETLFEIYVMHSKGVFGMPVKKADLGWDAAGKVMQPVDAVKAEMIEIQPLKLTSVKDAMTSEVSSVAEVPAKKAEKAPSKKQEQAKPVATAAPKAVAPPVKQPSAPATNGGKHEKASPERSSMQVPEAPIPGQPSVNPPLMTPDSYAMAGQRSKPSVQETVAPGAGEQAKPTNVLPKTSPTSTSPPVGDDVQRLLSKQFDSLYQRIDADRRVTEAAGAAKQDAMLRLVSSTLTENVEQSLSRIIGASVTNEVVPALVDTTSKLVDRNLGESLPQQLSTTLQREVKAALPAALQQALKDPQIHRTISEITANQVAQKVQQQVSSMLHQSLPGMAVQAAQKMVSDLEVRTTQRLREAETQRQHDSAKIDQLSGLVRSLSETLQNMADSQAAFQEQILSMQQNMNSEVAPAVDERDAEPAAEPVAAIDPQKAAEDEEVKQITQMLVAGDYEGATIQWLQSANQASLFDNLFVRVNPQYLQEVTPLVGLSVSAAITSSFETNVDARLDWLSAVLSQINMKDPDILDVAPKIMDVLIQRLQGAYMLISEENPSDGKLRKISALSRQVHEVRRMTG